MKHQGVNLDWPSRKGRHGRKGFTSFGPELILMLVAIAAVGLVGLCAARAADGELISPNGVPKTGSFYRMQRQTPPLPFNPFPDLPVYAVDWYRNIFLIDDRSVDYEQLKQERKAQAEAEGTDEDGPENGPAYDGYGTNLWIEIIGVTNNNAYLTLHNTRSNYYYQLLSKPDLNVLGWTLGEVVLNDAGTNQIYFAPVPLAAFTNQFFRGVEGLAALGIDLVQDAREPSATNANDGQTGLATVTLYQPVVAGSFTAVYQISGLASNAVDYTNLTGGLTITATDNPQYIWVSPYADNLVEFEETVTLRLVLTNGYVVFPDHAVATVLISDPYTNLFEIVATLDGPIGIDYHAPSNSLIVSYNYDASIPTNNFAQIYTNIVVSNSVVVTNVVITNWSGITGFGDEVKLATVKANLAGFTTGDMYFSSSNGIGWLSANGSVSNFNWCILTNAVQTNALPLRGGLYVDQTGVFSNQLIAVTSPGTGVPGNKGVWRVDSTGNPTLIANINTPHLEGVMTLTNDVTKWGPWAGKIITGDEDAVDNITGQPKPIIYAVGTNSVTSYALGIFPEDFDVIPPDQDLYCANYHPSGGSLILKVSRSWLTNYVGDLLVTDAGEVADPPKLFIVHWDAASTNFVTRSISLPPHIGGRFEHVTFAPLILPRENQ